MGANSKISWTDHTLNFWWGCVKVSPGCEHCYAETLSKRTGRDIWGPSKTTDRMRTKGPWNECLKWDEKALQSGQRRRVFVQSMSDFFEDHPQVTEWRNQACRALERFKTLDVQLLTKRPENILEMVPRHWLKNWPEHIWIGTSIENQAMANKRIPQLFDIPATVRFYSVEPMLESIELDMAYYVPDWVIVGGESGAGYRPFDPDWARVIRDQCQLAGVPFFMKQMGGFNKHEHMNDLPDDLRIREFPQTEPVEIKPEQERLF